MRKADWKVETVDSRPRQTAPYPPFITSTLQQEAAKRHGFTVQRTMREAQRLYEGVDVGAEGSVGLITYMRTDSPRMAGDMVHAVRAFVEESYGKNYLPPDPRVYKGKSEAQDAHECIRPTDVRRTPEAMREYLSADAYKLYRLVWERAVASQMASANYDATKAEISAGDYLFRAEGSVLRFEGFMKVYPPVKKTDDVILPPLSEGQALKLLGVEGKQHFTQPPARYTEATLVKTLEGNGIGRPSTYASIIAVIQNRDYVNKTEGKFVPTELGCLVVDMLLKQFEDIMDPTYTARLEEELDKIEEGKMEWREAIGEFYQKFSADLKKADTEMQKPVETTDEVCEKCGSPMVIRWGRFGKFMSCSAYPKCKNAKKLNGASGEGESAARELEEKCPECGKPLVERSGRFGSFVACSGYPACTYKKTPPAAETGVACTRKGCKGKIVERRSRRGKFFYGCTAYPGCDVVFWNRPVPRPCHKCGAAFVLLKTTKKEGSVYLCAQEKCGHKESVPEGDLPQKAAAT
jgi:DNA topoisomerase-1